MADDINLYDYMDGMDVLAIFLAALAAFFVGMIWFTALFGKRWAKEFDMPMDGGDMKSMLPSMLKDFVGHVLMAYVLWFVIMAFIPSIWGDHLGATAEDAGHWTYGMWGALFIWLGFFVPVALSRTGWEGRSWGWFGIDVGYNLVKLIVMGQILMAFF